MYYAVHTALFCTLGRQVEMRSSHINPQGALATDLHCLRSLLLILEVASQMSLCFYMFPHYLLLQSFQQFMSYKRPRATERSVSLKHMRLVVTVWTATWTGSPKGDVKMNQLLAKSRHSFTAQSQARKQQTTKD